MLAMTFFAVCFRQTDNTVHMQVVHDETGRVWLMLHSGSRNIGNIAAQNYDKIAQTQLAQQNIKVPGGLNYLEIDSTPGQQYLQVLTRHLVFNLQYSTIIVFRRHHLLLLLSHGECIPGAACSLCAHCNEFCMCASLFHHVRFLNVSIILLCTVSVDLCADAHQQVQIERCPLASNCCISMTASISCFNLHLSFGQAHRRAHCMASGQSVTLVFPTACTTKNAVYSCITVTLRFTGHDLVSILCLPEPEAYAGSHGGLC